MNLDPLNLRSTPSCAAHGRHVCLLCQDNEAAKIRVDEFQEALAEAQARIKELEGEATGNIHEIDRLLDDSKRLQLRAERAEAERDDYKRSEGMLALQLDELAGQYRALEAERDDWEAKFKIEETLALRYLDAVRANADQRDAALADVAEGVVVREHLRNELYAALADNAALLDAMKRVVVNRHNKGCVCPLCAVLYDDDADHPGAALLQELTALRAVAKYARHDLGCRYTDIPGAYVSCSCGFLDTIKPLDALRGKVAADE